jgi:hypothetical protein
MRHFEMLLCFICVCAISGFAWQQRTGQGQPSLVIIPREVVLPVIAHQPGCPLQFENISILGGVEGGGSPSFKVRNQGSRPIRAYEIVVLTSAGTSWGEKFEAKTPEEFMLSGQVMPQFHLSQSKILPLTQELRAKLNLQGAMKGIFVFMVVRAVFADNSTYTDESAYKALATYFEDLDNNNTSK